MGWGEVEGRSTLRPRLILYSRTQEQATTRQKRTFSCFQVLLNQAPLHSAPRALPRRPAHMRLPAPLFDRREALRLPLALAAVLAPFPSLPAHAISATTMSGKSKPELGMILVDAPKQTGSSITAEAVLPSGRVAAISYETKFNLVSGGYYDVESMATDGGDGAFVQIVTAPKGDLSSLKKDWFLQAICSVTGRYGSYGAPIDGKVLADDKSGATRMLDISFTVIPLPVQSLRPEPSPP